MKHILLFKIFKGDTQYVAECVDAPIITQGKTVDEVLANIKEALHLHFEEKSSFAEYGFVAQPSVLVNMELNFGNA